MTQRIRNTGGIVTSPMILLAIHMEWELFIVYEVEISIYERVEAGLWQISSHKETRLDNYTSAQHQLGYLVYPG